MSTHAPQPAASQPSDSHLNTRARLLRAATQCFARSGYDGTSMREIAAAADVAQQLITYHFGSKEQLWTAVVRSLHEDFMHTMNELRFRSDADPAMQFHAHQRRVFRDRIGSPFLARIWTQEFLSSPERFERTLQPILEDFGNDVAAPYFEAAARAGIGEHFTAAEAGLICHALLQLSILNPFFVERALGAPVDSDEGIYAQIELLSRILCGRSNDARSRKTGQSPAVAASVAADTSSENTAGEQELRLALADLALENRRLKRALAAASADDAEGDKPPQFDD